MATSASIIGNIIDMGEGITQHGHFWSENPNPGINDSKTELGPANAIGPYTSNLAGLKEGRSYYVRAYIKAGKEVLYGESKIFATLDTMATLTTSAVTEITPSSAISGGSIMNSGGSSVTSRGVCWSMTTGPDLEHNEGFIHLGSGDERCCTK